MNELNFSFVWKGLKGVAPLLVNSTRRVQKVAPINYSKPSMHILNKFWVLDYSISDYGYYRVGRNAQKWNRRPKNVAHLYPPKTPYFELLQDAPLPIIDSWITFKCELPELYQLVSRKTLFASFIDGSGEIMQLIDEIVLLARDYGEKAFWQAQAKFLEILDLLLYARKIGEGKYKISKITFQKQYSNDVAKAMEILNQNFERNLTLDDVARAINVSKSTLCHKFQKETGFSPMSMRLRCRIEAVKGLLLKGEPLKNIAEQTGFCDQFHLSKRFKQIVGLSPKKFLINIKRW